MKIRFSECIKFRKNIKLFSISSLGFAVLMILAASPASLAAPAGHPSFGITQVVAVMATLGLIIAAQCCNKSVSSNPAPSKPKGTDDAAEADKLNTARQYMQIALEQAIQAEGAASRTTSGSKDSRLAAAYQAQCYADTARNWADMATQKTYGASSAAQDAASSARNAANRAQAAADRARYNSETAA